MTEQTAAEQKAAAEKAASEKAVDTSNQKKYDGGPIPKVAKN